MPRKGFLAYIVPVDRGAHIEHPIVLPPEMPGEPPGIWGPTDPRPTPPIVIIPPDKPGKPPLVIWGGPIDPYPDHGLPGQPPGIWGPTDPRPTPPIHLPPMIWPQPPEGGPPIAIDPGHPEHPIVLPPLPPVDDAHPEHPIVIPVPPQIWGPPGPWPTPPIVIPPDPGSPPAEERPIDWKVGWTEDTGWVVVGIPSGEHVTPSKRRR